MYCREGTQRCTAEEEHKGVLQKKNTMMYCRGRTLRCTTVEEEHNALEEKTIFQLSLETGRGGGDLVNSLSDAARHRAVAVRTSDGTNVALAQCCSYCNTSTGR